MKYYIVWCGMHKEASPRLESKTEPNLKVRLEWSESTLGEVGLPPLEVP